MTLAAGRKALRAGFAPEYMDDAYLMCSACGGRDGSGVGNAFLICSRCDVVVHQACYGVGSIPKGDWFCDPCQAMLAGTEGEEVSIQHLSARKKRST